MEIIAKDRGQITEEDIEFLRQNYTSAGGLLPNAFSGGAFFTPTHVAKFVWDVLKPRLPETPKVLEPSVGAGVFLEHAPKDADITALELDSTSAKVTSLLYPDAEIIEGNALVHGRRDYYDLVIGNPPYGVSVKFEPQEDEEWRSITKKKGEYGGKSEVAFIELAIKAVKPGGYIAFVLPLGLSYGNYATKLRKFMHETCWQVATILLPSETFQHVGTAVSTQILILRKAPPGTRLISPATTKWSSNFRRGGDKDITEYDAKFLEGQPPAYFAQVTDIGWDAKGKSTDAWGDGLTQLDELVDNFTDDNLMRENLYPHLPSWHGIDKGNEAFFFSHGNSQCDGLRDAERTFSDGPYRWNELTLGAGDEIEWNGRMVSSFDFDWQDEIVRNYFDS
ncbi:HsdM family class I SAM-dependent methyltransferase [Bacillus velezensis]|uniref:HsdM family class I SAM-dependent methyltransferase n=1 Tax=Bacillus velezensis TaxID=492670 RepID=UPI00046EFC05|nr:N-6 DNA methylase [Bacillus velezensis]